MQSKLPDSVDFLRSVESNATYAGSWPIQHFKRLGGLLNSDAGEAAVVLTFSRKANIARLDGRITARLELECQRCLQPLEQHLNSEIHFGLIASEDDIAMLPESLEPFPLSGGEQSLVDVVEDELILSLPLVARHEANCTGIVSEDDGDASPPDTYKPFAALKDLMN